MLISRRSKCLSVSRRSKCLSVSVLISCSKCLSVKVYKLKLGLDIMESALEKRIRWQKDNNISGFGIITSEENSVVPDTLQSLSRECLPQHNHVVYLNGDLGDAISSVGRSPGLISSKWLVATDILGDERTISQGDRISFIETSIGDEREVMEKSISLGAKAVVRTAGIYDLVAVTDKSSRGRLEETLRLDKRVINLHGVKSTEELSVEISPSDSEVMLHGNSFRGFNKYEGPVHYSNDTEVNISYFEQCDVAAEKIALRHPDLSKVLIYAPLRGAKPMTKLILERLREISGQLPQVVYPVTSSFVTYDEAQSFYSKKGKKPASGRHGNILELRRLLNYIDDFSDMVYIDEIVSGGMMIGHCNEMIGPESTSKSADRYQGFLNEGVFRARSENGFGIHVYGLADAMGLRFRERIHEKMREYEKEGFMDL